MATEGLAPHHLEVLPGVADADFSTTVPVLGTVTDPYFPNYGWNLDNTGSNAYGQYAVATPTSTPRRAGTAARAPARSSPSSTPATTPTTPSSPARCGPTRVLRPADADGDGKAGDCHGWNFTTNSPDVDNGSYGTHGASVSGVIGGRPATARAPPASHPTSRSCRWSSAAGPRWT